MDTILLIDGENFKGKLKEVFKEAGRSRPTWHTYDFKGLFDAALADIRIERKVFYFAHIKGHRDSREKSERLIKEQLLLKAHLERQGFEVMLSGHVRGQWERGHHNEKVLVFREKGVDVKIAVDMVSLACDKTAREIIIASSDSDLQPAIKEVRGRDTSCMYLGFEAQPNKGLAYTTNQTRLIKSTDVLAFAKPQVESYCDSNSKEPDASRLETT